VPSLIGLSGQDGPRTSLSDARDGRGELRGPYMGFCPVWVAGGYWYLLFWQIG